MKFNEKLTELRKKQGLSQEELGYKLNVTRQTVSKWELGQTTPEMDKLIEMSKLFNISVDELINESEITSSTSTVIEDQPIAENKTKNNKIFIILVVALIIVIVLIIGKLFTAYSSFNALDKVTDGITNDTADVQKNIFDKFFSLFDKAIDMQENMIKDIENTSDEVNNVLELYKGSNSGLSLKKLLDEVITINKTEETKITIKYLETETQDEEEIKNLKTRFDDANNFEVSFEYDDEGKINEVTIERIFTQFEINRFNNLFEMYSGTKMGGHVTTLLDHIITSNKTEERKITVKYNQTETQDETEIKNIKREIGTFNNYEVTLEYDADGFINKAIIEKI